MIIAYINIFYSCYKEILIIITIIEFHKKNANLSNDIYICKLIQHNVKHCDPCPIYSFGISLLTDILGLTY